MHNIRFKQVKREDGYFEYRLLAKNHQDFLGTCIFYNTLKIEDDLQDEWRSYLNDKGLQYKGTGVEANLWLYQLIINFFRADNTVLMQYFDKSNNRFSQEASLSEWAYCWEYSIAYKAYFDRLSGELELFPSEYYPDNLACIRQFGFRNVQEKINDLNYSDKRLLNYHYYTIPVDNQQVMLCMETYLSDVSNWSFIYTKQESATKSYLQDKNNRPTLAGYFEHADLLLNLQIGEDEGYYEGIQLLSPTNIEDKIEQLNQKIMAFCMAYQAIVEEAKSYEEDSALYVFMSYFDDLENDYLT